MTLGDRIISLYKRLGISVDLPQSHQLLKELETPLLDPNGKPVQSQEGEPAKVDPEGEGK